jgi:hypothetical protein
LRLPLPGAGTLARWSLNVMHFVSLPGSHKSRATRSTRRIVPAFGISTRGMRSSLLYAWCESLALRLCVFWIPVLCLPMLAGCSIAQQPPPTVALPIAQPCPNAPRLSSGANAQPSAGDLYLLTLDLYEWGGDCARRLDAVINAQGS